MVAKRDEATTIVVTSEVQDNRSKVCRSPIDVVDPPCVPGQPKKRLLDDVLGSLAIIDEEPRQANKRPTLQFEKPDDEFLRRRADRLTVRSCGGNRHEEWGWA